MALPPEEDLFCRRPFSFSSWCLLLARLKLRNFFVHFKFLFFFFLYLISSPGRNVSHTSYSPIKVSRYTNWTFIIPFSAPQTLFLR